jgi:vacuolar protein sorting-associated protein 26
MEYLRSFYQTPPSLKINIEASSHKPFKYLENNRLKEYATFFPSDNIKGDFIIELNQNYFLEHQGIKVNLIGIIENTKNPSSSTKFYEEFLTISSADKINNEITKFNFNFPPKEKPYESYFGSSIKIRYYVCVNVLSSTNNLSNQIEIIILKPLSRELFLKEENPPLKMEIGVENLIHIIFEVNKTNYFLRDVIIGKVKIIECNLEIKYMVIQVIRKENLNILNSSSNENTLMSIFQLMDGSPEEGIEIPIRLYLSGIRSLTPSFTNIDDKFSVQYFLSIEFEDKEERTFFKKMEIKLERLGNMTRSNFILLKKSPKEKEKKEKSS